MAIPAYLVQNGLFQYVNQAFLDASGYTAEDVIGKMGPLDMLTEDSRPVMAEEIRKRLAGEVARPAYSCQGYTKQGCIVDLEVHGSIANYQGKPALIGSLLDITERKQAEAQLRDSRTESQATADLLQHIIESIPSRVFWKDRESRYLGCNTLFAQDAGLSRPEELIGKTDFDMGWRDQAELYRGDDQKTMTTAKPTLAYEEPQTTPDGDTIWLRTSKVPLYNANHNVMGILGLYDDITEQKQAMDTIRSQEQRLHELIELIPDALLMHQAGQVVFANPAAAAMFGYHRTEAMQGVALLNHIHRDNIDKAKARMAQFYAGERDHLVIEEQFQRLDGTGFTGELHAVKTMHDGTVAVMSILRDISVRKQKEIFEIDKRRLLERIINPQASLSSVLTTTVQAIERQRPGMLGSILLLDKAGARLRHGAAPNLPADYCKAIDGVAIGPHVGSCGTAAFTGKRVIVSDINSDPLWADYKELALSHGLAACWSEPIKGPAGEVLGTFAMYYQQVETPDESDIQLIVQAAALASNAIIHKRAEDKLQQDAKRLRTVLDAEFDAVIVHDGDRVFFANRQAQTIFGYADLESTVGRDPFDFVYPRYKGMTTKVMRRCMRTGRPSRRSEILAVRPDSGAIIPIEIACMPIEWNGKGAVVTMVHDISERKQQQQQLFLLNDAIAAVNESVIITDPEGVIVYCNPAFERLTGYSANEAVGRTPAMLNSHQQSQSFYQRYWQTIKAGKPWAGRLYDRRKDGTIIPVHLSVAPISAGGAITHYVAIHEDLTQSDLYQKKMMQSQKMEAVGVMAGGIAHDFNNLLAGLSGNLYLIRMHHRTDNEIVTRTEDMEASIMHGAKMIGQMLTFARKDHVEMHDVDLCSFIKEAYKLAAASLPENIALELDYDRADTWVHGDPTQLQQLILNLVTNARHAVKDSADPVIRLTLSHDTPPQVLLDEHMELISDSGWCCIRCRDNGCGISAGNLEHIFEPFFTTRGVGEGTGLGLAMSYGAVQNHRGLIDVQSVVGEGTTFSIYLPLSQTGEAEVIDQIDYSVDGRGRGVLVVDDNEQLRDVLANVLRFNGFTVWQASDGELALSEYRKYQEQIALVLMDVVMPNMGGVAAAQAIRGMDRQLPIIFLTGYGEEAQLQAAATIVHSASLGKPVAMPDLIGMIDAMMGDSPRL